MKCNINNMDNNSMAKAYGEDFNLCTNEIINTIEKIYKLESFDTNFRHEDVDVALYNCDYYIRPGKEKTQFMKKLQEIVREIKKDLYDKPEWLVHRRFSMEAIKLIKESFDEKYFMEQIACGREDISPVEKDKLISYFKRFDERQLKEFFTIMIVSRHEHGLFISGPSSAILWSNIDDACRELGHKVPMELDSDEGRKFIANNPIYYLKWLDKKIIANILCEAIDKDLSLANSVAKKFYKSGYEATLNYINIKLKERSIA